MPYIIGGPDYGNPSYTEAVQGLNTDVTIVPDRLQGVPLSDNMGRLVLFNDCQARTGFEAFSGAALSSSIGLMGLRSIKLNPISDVRISAWNFQNSQIGADFCFYLQQNQADISFGLATYNSTKKYQALLTFSLANGIFTVVDNVGPKTIYPFNPSVIFSGGFGWFPVKLVINPLAGFYVRANLGGNIIDLSTYQMGWTASGINDNGYMTAEVTTTNNGGFTAAPYLGYIALTRNEP